MPRGIPKAGHRKPGGGRPPIDPSGERTRPIQVHLTETHIEQARTIGQGNVSAGIRKALDVYQKDKNVGN